MEIKWSYGQVRIIEKDASPDPTWSYGTIFLFWEYEAAAGGVSPTGNIYGPFYGPLAGVI